jgi:Transposase DDE domain group 1
VVLDLAVALAVGGDCLADVAVLRAEPGVFGLVASDPTVSRLIAALAADAPKALAAIASARGAARAQGWRSAGAQAPDHGIDAEHPLVIDLDATLVTAHSDKESATRPSSVVTVSTRCARLPIRARPGRVKDQEPVGGTRQNPLTGRPRTPQPRKTSPTSQSENRQATTPDPRKIRAKRLADSGLTFQQVALNMPTITFQKGGKHGGHPLHNCIDFGGCSVCAAVRVDGP